MDILKQAAIVDLRNARTELLSIKKAELTYPDIEQWFMKWYQPLVRAESQIRALFVVNIRRFKEGFDGVSDPDLLDAVRVRIVNFLDHYITQLDQLQPVKPVLDERILKVKDTKLSTLLKEFNATRIGAPNMAAIGFRTILLLVIKERAKIVNPDSTLATKEDWDFEPALKKAIEEKIFDGADTKLLRTFLQGGNKAIFDNVAHKPGTNTLINKDDLSDAVDMLEKLLQSVES